MPSGLEAALTPPPTPDTVVTDLEDGGVEIDVRPHDAERPSPEHNSNLAEFMDEADLATIAEKVLNGLEVDRKSRADWDAMLTKGMDLLGLKMTERSNPFNGASGEYDPILLEAVLRNTATTCAELLPAQGPAKTQIVGLATEDSEQKSSRIKEFLNWYLYEGAPEWLDGMEQMFFWRAIAGSTFKKVYQDPILNRPVAPFLTSDQVVFNYHADSELETCPRVTHVIPYTYKELRERQLSGFYRDIELMPPGTDADTSPIREKVDSISGVSPPPALDDTDYVDMEFKCAEQHVDYDLKGFEHTDESGKKTGLPLPYIITVDKASRKVLAIRRNWREGDKSFQKNQYFVHYKLFPGLGAMGIGYAHILGNSAQAATGLLRQMKDAATLELFPGGMRIKGLRFDDNSKLIGPCEWVEVDTGGLPINQAFAPMPYKGPSEVSLALWDKTREAAKQMASMADLSVGDGRQDAPVGTTLALLEAANRLMSASVKSAHRSLKKELKLFAALFGQYLPEKPYPFPVPGGQAAIMRADFSDDVDVIPVSDPNITSYAQRVTRAEALLRMAQSAPPGIYDLRAANKNMLIEMGVDERKIDAILPPPPQAQPLDPLTENQNALTGKPLAVGQYQDHQAHIQAHQVLADQVPTIAAHIAEHLAAAMRVNVEKTIGIQLPPPGAKLPPEIENRLAVLVAQALQQLKSPNGPEPTPGQIAMEEIKVEAQRVMAIIQDSQQKAATEAYKATLQQQEKEKDRQAKAVEAERERQARMREKLLETQTRRAEAAANRAMRAQQPRQVN